MLSCGWKGTERSLDLMWVRKDGAIACSWAEEWHGERRGVWRTPWSLGYDGKFGIT